MTIDLTKKYRTRAGDDVELHDIVLMNSAGAYVTFPVKGSMIHLTPTGRKKRHYNIWTLGGRSDVLKESEFDLIEVKP